MTLLRSAVENDQIVLGYGRRFHHWQSQWLCDPPLETTYVNVHRDTKLPNGQQPQSVLLHNGDGLCGIPGTFKENTAFIYWTYGLKRYAVVVAQYLVIYRAGVNYG